MWNLFPDVDVITSVGSDATGTGVDFIPIIILMFVFIMFMLKKCFRGYNGYNGAVREVLD